MSRSNFDEFVIDMVATHLVCELGDEETLFKKVVASVWKHHDREALLARINLIDTLFQDAIQECTETVKDRVLEECK